jgi:protein phosphatase PTC1
MSSVATQSSNNLAGNKRRSLSGQGGLLNRMFGSSSDDKKDAVPGEGSQKVESPTSPSSNSSNAIDESKDEVSNDLRSPTRKSTDEGTSTEKKRRSSGVGRARDLFSSAKASLHNFGSSPDSKADKAPQTPMQRLGKMDPALSVPAGSLNNSAGESHPGPRSTFRVGVTEDKNKKCRRTMEDTHAYLYNFLSTPAPAIGSDTSSNGKNRASQADSTISGTSDPGVVETDNGYFAIFDGHAGTFAAEWCGKKVHILLEEIIRKNPNTPIPELLDMTFTSVDQQLEKLPLKNSGCTAVIAVLRWEDRIPNSHSATGSTAIAPAAAQAVKSDSKDSPNAEAEQAESRLRESASRQRVLYTANVGDARIVLCRNGKALRLSYDHKGSDENEGKRIAGAGGLILNNRVNGVLAVTRALGDAYMKDLVTGHPYTTETVIQPDIDEFLVLACDGVSIELLTIVLY